MNIYLPIGQEDNPKIADTGISLSFSFSMN